MDYSKKISQTSKQLNYIQSKPMNEQIKELITEQLKKKKNKNNKLMNKKSCCTRKVNECRFVYLTIIHLYIHKYTITLKSYFAQLNCKIYIYNMYVKSKLW